jgi:hypothetical protein
VKRDAKLRKTCKKKDNKAKEILKIIPNSLSHLPRAAYGLIR